MVDSPAHSLPALRPYDVDTAALLGELGAPYADDVAQLVRERDQLFLLYEALLEVDRAPSLEARLRVFVNAIRRIGFGRVTITLRDAAMNAALLVSAGLTPEEEEDLRRQPTSGETWRRRLPQLERFRVSNSYYLDGRDPWVVREFLGGLPSASEPGDDPMWSPRDSLMVMLRGREGRILATLSLDDPQDRRRPTLARVRTVELFGQQVANVIEQAELVSLAERRAERLQRLQEIGSMLARSLDEREIVREIARQVGRVMPLDGVVIAHPDLEAGRTTTALRIVRGVERPRPVLPLGNGAVAHAARLGRPVRINDYDHEVSTIAAADDVVGGAERAGSVLVVPMLAGIQLMGVIAVHDSRKDAYSAEDEELLLTIGAQAATALTNARLYADSQRERRQNEALADIARAVSESLRLGEVLQLIMRHAMALLRTDGATVALRKEDYFHILAGQGCGEPLAGMLVPVASSLAGRAMREGRFQVTNDARREPLVYPPARDVVDMRRTLLVPLVTGRGPIGVLTVINRDADFSETDALVLQRLADQVAVAIVNAGLYEEVAEATREWRVAFDAIASGMVVLDEDGRIGRANARAAQLSAHAGSEGAASQLTGRDFHEAVLGEQHAEGEECPVESALGRYASARASVRSTARGRIFDIIAAPHPSGGAVVTFDDVTQQHALAERYRRVVETANDAIVITDRDRRIAFCNPAALELFGAATGLVGRPVADLVPPEIGDEVRQREDLAFSGQPQRYEATVLRLDGERRTVSVSTAPLLETGRITGVVASLRDVTAERRARDAVAHSEARYRNLFENASDAIYTLDPRGFFTSANAATCRETGVGREGLLGRSIVPFLDPEEVEMVKGNFKRALGGESSNYECAFIRGSGERRMVSVTNTPIRHGDDVIGVLGIARDMTSERERAAALERSEARYTRLVESASDAIFTVDEEGHFTAVNRALESATGRSREELLGRHFTEIVDARDRADTWQLFVETLGGGRQKRDFRYHAANGEIRNAAIISAPIIEGGRVVGGLGVVRDTTDEKHLFEQLVQQEKLAAIGQLVSGVAHELNNPLAGVMAFSQLLLASPDVEDEDREAVETIHGEARRAAKIVSNLLTFARQHQPERRPTDVNQVLEDTLQLRRHALGVQGIALETRLAAGVPQTWADPFQLQQVFINLLGNAEQAVSEREGERRITVETRHEAGNIVVSVRDTGDGISPEATSRIFNPFYTTKPVGKGTGLGLSISDGIVREHGGRIAVESAPGEGAAFVVELPVIEPPPPGRVPAGARDVLVVLADDALRAQAVRWLEGRGDRVVEAREASEMLTCARARQWDAVVLDSSMPGAAAAWDELARMSPEAAARVLLVRAADGLRDPDLVRIVRDLRRPPVRASHLFEDLAVALSQGGKR